MGCSVCDTSTSPTAATKLRKILQKPGIKKLASRILYKSLARFNSKVRKLQLNILFKLDNRRVQVIIYLFVDGLQFNRKIMLCPPSRIDGQKETRYNGKEGRQRR